jgi:hypothetical protein
MDVIVTIDTAVVHLAGGLAAPAYLMLPFDPNRRWMLSRDDSHGTRRHGCSAKRQGGAWKPVVHAGGTRLGSGTL